MLLARVWAALAHGWMGSALEFGGLGRLSMGSAGEFGGLVGLVEHRLVARIHRQPRGRFSRVCATFGLVDGSRSGSLKSSRIIRAGLSFFGMNSLVAPRRATALTALASARHLQHGTQV